MSQHPAKISDKWVHMEFLRSSLAGLDDGNDVILGDNIDLKF